MSRYSRREEGAEAREQELLHKSVMAREVQQALAPKKEELIVDATAGQGGHSEALLRAGASVLALDADPQSVAATQERLAAYGERAKVVEANFADLLQVLKQEDISIIQGALFDLGWNSAQLGEGKGFSFLAEEPLTMSYGERPLSGFTAAEILNTWDESARADMLYGYGEERYARRIARAIVERRKVAPFAQTGELVELVRDAVPPAYRHGRINPATRTFQALRMAVNDELGAIDKGVTAAWQHLDSSARLAVITFHSVEDRAVKRLFAHFVKEEGGILVVKKPLTPTRTEIIDNPRSRSAKLRIIEKP